jgi:hypothetical protein
VTTQREIKRIVRPRNKGTQIFFDFKCPGCGAEGELGIKMGESGTISCPNGCGAIFLPWDDEGIYKLTCVVCPVFEYEDLGTANGADSSRERPAGGKENA